MQDLSIKIIRKSGAIEPLNSYLTKTVVVSAEQRRALLGEDVVVMDITSAVDRGFSIGDMVTFGGMIYKINQIPQTIKEAERRFRYTLQMEGIQYDLGKVIFFNDDVTHFNTSSEFNLVGDVEMFLNVIINNANRAFGAGVWVLGDFPTGTEAKNLQFNNEYCLGVLNRICEEYDYQFYISYEAGQNVLNVLRIGEDLNFTFRVGKGKGLYTLTRRKVEQTDIVNYLYASGSDKNLRSNYKNYSNRLILGDGSTPSAIFDADSIAAYGKREGIQIFEDVFPHRTGSITGLDANKNVFADSTMPFDLNETDGGETLYLIAGNAAKVHFNTGNLGGYEFELTSYNHTTKKFTVKPYVDARGLVFPNPDEAAFQFQVGDEYVLIDIMLPDSYVEAAEDLLLEKAQEYLAKSKLPFVQYELEISEDFIAQKAITANSFELCDTVEIIDMDLNINTRIKIVGFARSLLRPNKYKLIIADLPDNSDFYNLMSSNQTLRTLAKLNKLENANKAKQNWKTDSQINTDFEGAIADLSADYWAIGGNILTAKTLLGGASGGNYDVGITRNGVEKITIGNTLVTFANGIKATNPALATTSTKVLVDDSGEIKTRTIAEMVADLAAWINGGIALTAKGFLGSYTGNFDIGIVRANSEKMTIKASEVEVLTQLKAANPALGSTAAKFVVDDSGVFKTRTKTEMLADLGVSGGSISGGGAKSGNVQTASLSDETLSGIRVVGGRQIGAGDFLLLMGQTTGGVGKYNGIWQVGQSWTVRPSSSQSGWIKVCYGNGLFVAVAYDTTNQVMTSPDGITWTTRTAATANGYYSVCYGNGLFVAVAQSGSANRAMTSPDGITWTVRTTPNQFWGFVEYGGGIFVAIAFNNNIMTSPDGITWTARTVPESNTWSGLTYGNGLFVAVSQTGTNRIMTSPDGITWTARAAPDVIGYFSVCFGGGLFVSLASSSNTFMTSPDGITWTSRTMTGTAQSWISIAYGNGMFVAVSYNNTPTAYSLDGINWTRVNLPVAQTWNAIAFGGGMFVALSQTGTNRVATLDGAWIRPAAYDTDPELRGKFHLVEYGTYANQKFINTNASAITVDTTPITYSSYQDIDNWNLASMLVSSNGNLRLKNMTTFQRTSLTAQVGEVVFDTTENKPYIYTSGGWKYFNLT